MEVNARKFSDTGFNWHPYKETPTLFIQIGGGAFKDEMDALNRRQEIEKKIDEILKYQSLGEWFAGDLGPGGANMLFKVGSIERATSVIQEVLLDYKLDNYAVIGRRIYTSAHEWFYEVLFPVDFTGDLLTM